MGDRLRTAHRRRFVLPLSGSEVLPARRLRRHHLFRNRVTLTPPHHAQHQCARYSRRCRAPLPPGNAGCASRLSTFCESVLEILPHLLRGWRVEQLRFQRLMQRAMPCQLLRTCLALLQMRLHPPRTLAVYRAVDIFFHPPANQRAFHRCSSSCGCRFSNRRRKLLRARCKRTLTAATEQFITSAISSSDSS